jgi:FAD synthase
MGIQSEKDIKDEIAIFEEKKCDQSEIKVVSDTQPSVKFDSFHELMSQIENDVPIGKPLSDQEEKQQAKK